jgi:hypothetical protein
MESKESILFVILILVIANLVVDYFIIDQFDKGIIDLKKFIFNHSQSSCTCNCCQNATNSTKSILIFNITNESTPNIGILG